MSILRDYQRQAVRAFWDTLLDDAVNRVAIEMATGLGKTITLAGAADQYLDGFEGAGNRVLILVHTDELVRQTVAKVAIEATSQPWTIGVVKAKENDTDADIVVASVQTLAQAGRKEQIEHVGLIIVDECQHSTAPTYMGILTYYGAFRAERPTPVLGVTATLKRSDGTPLGNVFQALAFTRDLSWGIRHGHLIDLVPYTIRIPDVTFSDDPAAMDTQMAESIAPEAVVDAWLEHVILSNVDPDKDEDLYRPYPSTVLFAPLVASAQRFADAFNAQGIKAEVISDKVPLDERRAILARYEAGVTAVVCNAMVLTEGWDSPRTMCVIVARPCKRLADGSCPPLFIQMVGRGARPWLEAEAPPRADQFCTVLCVSDMSGRLATFADLSERPVEAVDGKSLLQMEDEYDLGRDLLPDEVAEYRGPLKVERWDALVQASSKAWKYTEGGAPFLPTAKRSQGYVFVVERAGAWTIWSRWVMPGTAERALVRKLAEAPDLELAMALAEDRAQDLGGDLGALLADKSRAWRKQVPSAAMQEQAQRLGINLIPIMESRAGGKAGKLSDLIDRVQATRVLDPVVSKIKARV